MLQRRRAPVKNLSDALNEDGCPLCIVLKGFQACYLSELDRHEVNCLCGFHVWMVAKTAEARSAATLFLRLLSNPLGQEATARTCDVCARIAQEEQHLIRELLANVNRSDWEAWLRHHGALCRPHALRVLGQAPKTAQGAIHLALSRRRSELTQKLTDLLRHSDGNLPAQPGVLGRAAEYLTAQRGLHQ